MTKLKLGKIRYEIKEERHDIELNSKNYTNKCNNPLDCQSWGVAYHI